MYLKAMFFLLKHLPDINEFVHDKQRVTRYRHICPGVVSPELWSKLFYEFHTTCPRYSWQYMSRFLQSSTGLHDTFTSSTICIQEPNNISTSSREFVRVPHNHWRVSMISCDKLRYVKEAQLVVCIYQLSGHWLQ